MRPRILTITLVGITIGFLLALGVVAFLRAVLEGEDAKLSIAFTAFVMFLAATLVWYVTKLPGRA
jgi:hypothetical protein